MSPWSDLGLKARERPLAGLALGFLLGFGSLAGVALLAVFLGGRSFAAAHSASQIMAHVAGTALAAIIVSFLEEIIFRGALFGILRKSLSWPAALVLSSAVYALAHFLGRAELTGPVGWWSGLALLPKMVHGGPPLVPAVLSLFVAGAILALAYQRTGALFVSMGLHAGWIFWLKFYGFLTVKAPGGNPSLWGGDGLVDGWLALPVLGCVFWIVSKLKMSGARTEGQWV
jgi:membrane protease YdiL (CAAX protease family)